MKIKQLLFLLTIVTASVFTQVFAQTGKMQIKKIVFYYDPGFWTYQRPVTYELSPGGNIRLYNPNYDSLSSFDRILGRPLEDGERAQIEISADQLHEIANQSSYYEGNIGSKRFSDLSSSIFKHINDTTQKDWNSFLLCGSDVSFGEIKVYYGYNDYFWFNFCFGNKEKLALFDIFYDIAYLKGFKRSTTKFKIDTYLD